MARRTKDSRIAGNARSGVAHQRMVRPRCRKCKVAMKDGQALINTLVLHDDFGGDAASNGCTMSYSGAAQMVACWKCPKCGKSLTRSNAALCHPAEDAGSARQTTELNMSDERKAGAGLAAASGSP